MPFVEIMPPAEIMSATPKPSSRQRIARRPSVHTGLPSSWNNSLRQCAGAILLFALATVVTQQAALGVVLLGLVRSFALLVFIAGGVMYPYSRIRAAQQARRDASQDPDAKAEASRVPASPKSFPQSFPQSGGSGATRGVVRRSQAPPPSGSGADATSVAAEAAASPPRVDGPSRPTGSARRLTVKSKPFWETREKSKSTGLPKASSSEPTREGSAPPAATPSGLTPLLKDQAQIWPSAEDDRVSPLQLPNASPRASPTASPAAAPAQGKHGTTAPVFGAGGRLCRNGPARSASAAGQRGPSG